MYTLISMQLSCFIPRTWQRTPTATAVCGRSCLVGCGAVQFGKSPLTFRRYILPPFSRQKNKPSKEPAICEHGLLIGWPFDLKMKAIWSFETSVYFYRATRRKCPQHGTLLVAYRACQCFAAGYCDRDVERNHSPGEERVFVLVTQPTTCWYHIWFLNPEICQENFQLLINVTFLLRVTIPDLVRTAIFWDVAW
jgi:hypothetical protein